MNFDPFSTGLLALQAAQQPEQFAQFAAKAGIPPPGSPGATGGELGQLLQPAPPASSVPVPGTTLTAPSEGGVIPDVTSAATPAPEADATLKKLLGVQAPPPPRGPNISQPAAPRPSQAIQPSAALLGLLQGQSQQRQPALNLAALLGGRRG